MGRKMEPKTIEKIKEILKEKEVVLTEILDITHEGNLNSETIEKKEDLILKVEGYDQAFLKLYDLDDFQETKLKNEVKEIQHLVKHMIFLTEEIEKNEMYNYNMSSKKMKHTKENLNNIKPVKKMVNRYKIRDVE